MEDLFLNFADHLSHIISPNLGNQVKQYLKRRLHQNNNPEEYMHEMILSDKDMPNKEIKVEEDM